MKRRISKGMLSNSAFDALITEAKRPKSLNENRFITLGWKILEAKFRYYQLNESDLSDAEYDALEREYDGLAKQLGVVPTATDMVGFDTTKPSSYLVSDKIEGRNKPVARKL